MDEEEYLDSYEEAYQRLSLITREAGWFVYCYVEEEWHLYNDDGELLASTKTIEELVEHACPPIWRQVGNSSLNITDYPQRAYDPPTTPELDYTPYEDRTRNRHGPRDDQHP